MVDFSLPEAGGVLICMDIPKPVIIFTGVPVLSTWKRFFDQKVEESTSPDERLSYKRCLKLLIWAEFCNATLTYVGNSKNSANNLQVKFAFSFPYLARSEFLFISNLTDEFFDTVLESD